MPKRIEFSRDVSNFGEKPQMTAVRLHTTGHWHAQYSVKGIPTRRMVKRSSQEGAIAVAHEKLDQLFREFFPDAPMPGNQRTTTNDDGTVVADEEGPREDSPWFLPDLLISAEWQKMRPDKIQWHPNLDAESKRQIRMDWYREKFGRRPESQPEVRKVTDREISDTAIRSLVTVRENVRDLITEAAKPREVTEHDKELMRAAAFIDVGPNNMDQVPPPLYAAVVELKALRASLYLATVNDPMVAVEEKPDLNALKMAFDIAHKMQSRRAKEVQPTHPMEPGDSRAMQNMKVLTGRAEIPEPI